MPTIKSLFDENLTFERRVEKVITFSNRREDILKNEARDYVLTDNLTREYERLLNFFDDAQSRVGHRNPQPPLLKARGDGYRAAFRLGFKTVFNGVFNQGLQHHGRE